MSCMRGFIEQQKKEVLQKCCVDGKIESFEASPRPCSGSLLKRKKKEEVLTFVLSLDIMMLIS